MAHETQMLPPQADALVGFASIQATLWSRPDRPVASRRAAPKRCSRPRRQQLVLLDSTVSATSSARSPRSVAIPVVMCDVLDTLVADPFTRGMAEHLGFDDFKEFLDAKTPDIWPDFELGRVSEDQLSRHFFKDKSRRLDVPAMKRFLLKAYAFNPGVEDMLRFLRESGVEVHLDRAEFEARARARRSVDVRVRLRGASQAEFDRVRARRG
jgi:hypothetical protein